MPDPKARFKVLQAPVIRTLCILRESASIDHLALQHPLHYAARQDQNQVRPGRPILMACTLKMSLRTQKTMM